jgi:hypothetical protein
VGGVPPSLWPRPVPTGAGLAPFSDYRSNSASLAAAMNASHSVGVNVSTGPVLSLLSRTCTRSSFQRTFGRCCQRGHAYQRG